MVGVRVIPALAIIILLTACGGGSTDSSSSIGTPLNPSETLNPGPTAASEDIALSTTPAWQYVNSGWVEPQDQADVGPFGQQLRAFVITSQEDLDAYQENSKIRISKGTTTSLGRIDFPKSILIAAYYMWRPLQGDPLAVVGFSLDDRKAEVLLELDDAPQGKEYPYLFAPMTMVAFDRSLFPTGETIDFAFHLNGEYLTTVFAIVE